MSHYNPKDHKVSLRCDGDHEFGEPYLHDSSMSVELEDGTVYLRVSWVIAAGCQKPYTNDVKNAYSTCQYVKTVERDREMIPVSKLSETVK